MITAHAGPRPLYQILTEQYKQAILTQIYPPGGRIDSTHKMIRRHRVSRETVKKVLQSLRQQGLIMKKPGKGSFVADLGPLQNVLGVIVPFFASQIEQLLRHLRRRIAPLGCCLEAFLDYNNWQEEIRLVAQLITQRYEAAIVVLTFNESKTAQFYRRLQTSKPIVSLLNHATPVRPFLMLFRATIWARTRRCNICCSAVAARSAISKTRPGPDKIWCSR
ncbi:MAG TPA: GntR family transcriptional regulator [bacterium]|nr:GntR family transcriptional regulator [bacterium]HPN36640.1 GntR family transcriptional regulator [bacterium]